MRRTLALLGLPVAGLTLVMSPSLDLLSGGATDATTLAIDAVTTPAQVTVVEDPATTTTERDQPGADATTTQATTTTIPPLRLTITGPAVDTRFGAFQVEITVTEERLLEVVTLEQPGDRRSRSINASVLPAYAAAAIDAQSADIDAISGATITWQAYTESLQAALDQAGL